MRFTIKQNTPLTSCVYRMVLQGDTSAITAPGQFVQVQVPGFYLRRPISVCDWDSETLTLVYKVVGNGMDAMCRMIPGTELDLLTGLGNGFDITRCGERPLLIGGGVGLPPMVGLCRCLMQAGKHPTVLAGFNTADEVFLREDVEKLGIMTGDFVCFDPRTTVTASGYIKSRFLDDKLSVGILLGYAKYLKEENVTPERMIYQHITVFEEVGHGGAASVPEGVTEVISVDMGCVGDGLACDETQVSICAKDSHGPYHYDVVNGLVKAAKENGIDFTVDVYPYYGSDADVALSAGYDVRHGLIGSGVYASHGYERSHVDGVKNTFELLKAYLG